MQGTLTLGKTAYIIEKARTEIQINKETKHPQPRPFRKSSHIFMGGVCKSTLVKRTSDRNASKLSGSEDITL